MSQPNTDLCSFVFGSDQVQPSDTRSVAVALKEDAGLRVVDVYGDGSCWSYALLASFGICEHSRERFGHPTATDRALDVALREQVSRSHT